MSPPGEGASGPVRRLGAALLALGRIRLELLAVEVQEEKQRVASLLLWVVLTGLLSCFGAVFIALFVTVALWDTNRLIALGAAAAAFSGFALLAALRMRRLSDGRSTLFESSIAELRQDSSALGTGAPP